MTNDTYSLRTSPSQRGCPQGGGVFLLLLLLFTTTLSFAQQLPQIAVVTDGPIVNSPAVHGTITVTDAEGHAITMHAGFKIRGTSSQQYDKKSYRVELWADATGTEMADTTFLGMRSDDDWNLEALWAQPLRLRDKVANALWMEMYQLPYLENEPEALAGVRMEYAELTLNGEYQGLYALSERIDRKQLALRKYNGNLRGVLYKGNGPGAPTFEELPPFDNSLDEWGNYEWVYPNEADTAIDWEHLYGFTNFVMNASDIVFYSQYTTQFDKDNAIRYYLFINALQAMDNMGRNLFLARYKKSGPYFYVPWDLDAVWGLDTEGHRTWEAEGLMSNGFYDRLTSDCYAGGFVEAAQLCYTALRQDLLTTDHIMALVQKEYDYLQATGAYEREHEAWPDFTVDPTQLDYLRWWLDARFAYLDRELFAPCGTWSVQEIQVPEPGQIQVPEPVEGPTLSVYPNPTYTQLTLSFTAPVAALVQLYDRTGRLVRTATLNGTTLTLSVEGLPQGLYTLVAHSEGERWRSGVVVR